MAGQPVNGWVAVDLDGTLAEYHGWAGALSIGPPIPLMAERVKTWLRAGVDVRIFTARVCPGTNPDATLEEIRQAINGWSLEHLGSVLPVTHEKDYGMVELWDDRAVQVFPNTGIRVDGEQ